MATKTKLKHYGTVRVPGINSVCYKIGFNAPIPKGYRCVGNGTGYLYITNGEVNHAHDVCICFAQKRKEWADWQIMQGPVGKTRAQINKWLRNHGEQTSTSKMVHEFVSTVDCQIKITYRTPQV